MIRRTRSSPSFTMYPQNLYGNQCLVELLTTTLTRWRWSYLTYISNFISYFPEEKIPCSYRDNSFFSNFNNLDWGPVPRFAPWKHCSQCGLLYDSSFSKRSYFGRQVSLATTTRGSPLAARGRTMGEKWWLNGAWDMHPGFFYMPQICVLRIFIAL